jgi:hypothetical protein
MGGQRIAFSSPARDNGHLRGPAAADPVARQPAAAAPARPMAAARTRCAGASVDSGPSAAELRAYDCDGVRPIVESRCQTIP